jgi:hypothetical protein
MIWLFYFLGEKLFSIFIPIPFQLINNCILNMVEEGDKKEWKSQTWILQQIF